MEWIPLILFVLAVDILFAFDGSNEARLTVTLWKPFMIPGHKLVFHVPKSPADIKPKPLIIYVTCGLGGGGKKYNFSIEKSRVPAIGIECNHETNEIDCHESVAMLNFAIQVYDRPLAERYIFVHGHDRSWHYTRDLFEALDELMNSSYYRDGKVKYGGIFDDKYNTFREPAFFAELYEYVYNNTSMSSFKSTPRQIHEHNQHPCCATFWMDSSLIRSRPREEYVIIRERLRQWSREHQDPAPACGRLMEWTWHILFSKSEFVPPRICGLNTSLHIPSLCSI